MRALPRTFTKSSKDQNGFSLLEILVAVMVLATALVVILQLFSGGLRSGRLSDQYTRALFHARSKMEELLLLDKLMDTELNGEINTDFTWYAKIEWVPPGTEIEKRQHVDMFHITVNVGWAEGIKNKRVEISTLTIARKIKTET